MRLSAASLAGLFALGAAGALLGDQGHVASGTTTYLSASKGVPFVWESPLWFPALVGVLTASLAELRLRIAPPRGIGGWSDGAAAVAAVLALYAVTALVRHEPLGPSTVLVYALAVLVWRLFGNDLPSAACGAVAAIVGVTSEIVLVAAGVFEYSHQIDRLAGVAPWLPGLYFAFGVVVARLGELCSRERVALHAVRERSLQSGDGLVPRRPVSKEGPP